MQENNTRNSTMPDAAAATTPAVKQPYHPPTLTNYGGLVELVQTKPSAGADGSPFPDCRKP